MFVPTSRAARIAAVAAGLAAASAAHAQSSVTVFGLVDMSAGQFQAAGAPKVKKAESGSMTTSHLGFKGREDLGGGLAAIFSIESFLRADLGQNGRFNGDRFWARNAYVGVASNIGTVRLGRNTTPLFVSSLSFNAFGDSYGFSPTMRHVFLGGVGEVAGDSAWDNSVLVETPNFGGFSAVGVLNAGEGSGTGRNWSVRASYAGGPFGATAVWQEVKNGITGASFAGLEKQGTGQIGLTYDLRAAKLFAQYTDVKSQFAGGGDRRAKITSVGTSVPIGNGKLLAQYGYTRYSGKDDKRKTGSLGYDHDLSKRTDVYAVYMNDKFTGQSTGNSYAVGIRHRF